MSVLLLNQSSFIGQVIVGMTNSITGSIFLTLVLILIVLYVLCIATGLPFGIIALNLTAFLIAATLYDTHFIAFWLFVIFYAAMIVTGAAKSLFD